MACWARCSVCDYPVGKSNLVNGKCPDNCKIGKWKKALRNDRTARQKIKMREYMQKFKLGRPVELRIKRVNWKEAMEGVIYEDYNLVL